MKFNTIFEDLPNGWNIDDLEVQIQTRFGYTNRAWRLSNKNFELAAVEHETGLEILITIGVGLVKSAIYDLIKTRFEKWTNKRKLIASNGTPKAATFLEIERTKRDANGNILNSEVIKFRAPVDGETMNKILDRIIK